jgi:hypothetical protein
LSVRTDLKKQFGHMYFVVNVFASLRCINDIPLMNFSILPHGDLCMCRGVSAISIFFFLLPGIRRSANPRFRWDCKGRNLFRTAKSFLTFSETFYRPKRFSSFSSSSLPSPSSEAECKGRKIIPARKRYCNVLLEPALKRWYRGGKV